MWHIARFCSSHAYIARVQGLTKLSCSTSSTPLRSASPASASMTNGAFTVLSSGRARGFGQARHQAAGRTAAGWHLAPGDSLTFERIDRTTFDAIARQVEAGTLDWSLFYSDWSELITS